MKVFLTPATALVFAVFGIALVHADTDPNLGAKKKAIGETYSIVKEQFLSTKGEIESLEVVVAAIEKDPAAKSGLTGTLASLKKLLQELEKANAARKAALDQIRKDFSQ